MFINYIRINFHICIDLKRLSNNNEPSSPDKSGSINLSGCGIIPKIFLLLFNIPAILFDEPLGLEFLFILPFLSQYLKATKLLVRDNNLRIIIMKSDQNIVNNILL